MQILEPHRHLGKAAGFSLASRALDSGRPRGTKTDNANENKGVAQIRMGAMEPGPGPRGGAGRALFRIPLDGAPAPEDALARVRGLPYPILLQSAGEPGPGKRYSFLVADPRWVLRARGGATWRWDTDRPESGWLPVEADPFSALAEALEREPRPPLIPDFSPFQGGAVGYLGYELAGALEAVDPAPAVGPGLPWMHLGFYPQGVVWDHQREEVWYFHAQETAEGSLLRALTAPPGHLPSIPWDPPAGPEAIPSHPVPALAGVSSTVSRSGYLDQVEAVRRLILEGEIFQANLTQAFHRPWTGDPLALFRYLLRQHPAPFSAFLDLGSEGTVVSASPESFLRLEPGEGPRTVRTRPIKGTAPRGADLEEDRARARALQASEKDRAENVMIVDLLRNDLSRVCGDASVVVEDLCALEPHPSVHHLVSTIRGELLPGLGPVDLLKATFPCGSITGAPKIRAMEILATLESTQREVYTGAIGWVGLHGGMDLNVAIRTLTLKDGRAWFPAGGGVVLASSPEAEYDESVMKVRGLAAALEATQ
jgi:para-aminobenzoate synthetase component I